MSDVKASILVVDDDLAIRELLHEHLSRVGYDVLTAAEGEGMRERLAQSRVDLIVLDVMMPGDDGFTLCREIREHSQVPIIMLTASSDETDRVVGLEIGADDYLAKPFSARELQARVKALLRRSSFTRADNPRFVRFDRWRLDTLAHELISEQGCATPCLAPILPCYSFFFLTLTRCLIVTPFPALPVAGSPCRLIGLWMSRSVVCGSVSVIRGVTPG